MGSRGSRHAQIQVVGAKSTGFSGLTIRSSRDRFAASAWRRRLCHRRGRKSVRLNSGVSAQKKQISAKSFLDKRHKSFSDPLSPALRHISDLIHLRAVSDLLAPGNLSHPRHRANSQLQRANNSFKPTPLRGVVVTFSHPSVPASATLPQRRGLIQALCAVKAQLVRGHDFGRPTRPRRGAEIAFLPEPASLRPAFGSARQSDSKQRSRRLLSPCQAGSRVPPLLSLRSLP